MGLFSKRPEPADFRPRQHQPVLHPNEMEFEVIEEQLSPASPPKGEAEEPPEELEAAPALPPPLPPPAHVAVSVTPVLPPPLPAAPKFGIEDAVRLLRVLPGRDSAAVRDAVQRTLAYVHVDLERLLEEAAARSADLEARAMSIELEVERHEALALAAKKELAALVVQRAELDATKCWMLERSAQVKSSSKVEQRMSKN